MLFRSIPRFASFGILVLAAAALTPAQEPVPPKLNSRIITATRQVTLFTRLETQLLQAIRKKDQTALNNLVAEDLYIEMPSADPVAGEDWVPQVLGKDYNLQSFIIRGMSVADLGDAAIVKFDRLQNAAFKGKDQSGEFFVVDVWKKSGDSWKLANRYVARVGPVPPAAKVPPRPTGKQ
jgi:ketosteroid isomerase-like protein